jgi:uncharacterized protein involved in outer membrane biogenesis
MKKLLIVLGVAIIVAGGVVAVVVANLNSYLNENRDWIASQLESVLGRSVTFGEVGVSLRGGLGARVADLKIGDDPAFSNEPFVTAGAIDVRVAILPALFGNIEVGQVVLRSPSITVVQTAQGMSTSTLGAAEDEKIADEAEAPAQEAGLPAFVVASIEISDGTLRFIDKTAKPAAETSIEKLDFKASNISLDGTIPFEVEAAILGASRQNIRIVGQVKDLANPTANFTLTSNALEIGREPGEAPTHTLRDVELKGSLSLPKSGPQVGAALRSPHGTFAGADYRDLQVDFKLQDQVATIEKLAASAFDGEIGVSGRYDMRNAKRPRFDLQATLSSLRLEQIVANVSPQSAEKMQGELGGTLVLAASGTDWEQIKPSLTGRGNVLLVDGVLKDVNLAETALKGITGVPGLANLLPASLRSQYSAVFGVGDTVFENMDAKIDIRDGQVQLRDFRLAARDYAVVGEGRYSLDNELDLSTVMTFSQALSDDLVEAAEPMAYLRSAEGRVALPVKLVGAPPDINTIPDLGYIAKAASREATGRLLDRVLGTEKKQAPAGEEPSTPSAKDAASELLERGMGELFR